MSATKERLLQYKPFLKKEAIYFQMNDPISKHLNF